MHDPPDRAEQAHVRRHRADGGQERQVLLGGIQFALEARAHRAAGTVEQRGRVGHVALAQLLVFAHAAGENAFHGAGELGILRGRGEQLVQAGARPELALEIVVEHADALEGEVLADDGGPAGDRHDHQQQHDQLHHEAGVEQEIDDGEILVHGLKG
ncbi:hypothetical protein D9M69_649080 [compost metagenome]